MKKGKKKPVAKKINKIKRPHTDSIGRTYRIDPVVLKTKLQGSLGSLIETGVRQFLGIEETPTPQMMEFLHTLGVITTRSHVESDQPLYS